MPYSVITDFRGGVDRRRPAHALPPGTLWDGINCHITRGGDVEKRKAFVWQGNFSANTFGLVAQGDILFTFGSEPQANVTLPSGVSYQRLQHPDGAPMSALLATDLFGGEVFAIAEYQGGGICLFYGGVIVADWTDGIVRATQLGLSAVATALAALIDASPNYVASASGAVVTVTAQTAGTPFLVAVQALNGGDANDQGITDVNVTPNTAPVAGIAANASFQITAGTAAGTITSLTIDGVEILGAVITWGTSNSATATAVAAQISSGSGTHHWQANATSETVNIARDSVGVSHNGATLAGTWTGTITINTVAAATAKPITQTVGGVDIVVAVAQVDHVTLSGTFDPGDSFGVKLISGDLSPVTEYFGNYAKPFGIATCLKTHKRKLYVGMGPLVEFCKVNDATKWNVDVDPGAGFLNASTHVGGSESAAAFGTYQERLAILSRRAIQLWLMQNDDTQNDLLQVIENTGTRSPRSVLEFGGNDVFYLDDTGIRSLRARDASNNAYLSDVGVAIDRLVQEWMRSGVTEDQIVGAAAVIEPIDGRFMLALGTRIYVYSYFFSSRVAAWTWYEPGFTAQWLVRTKTRVYARGDDNVLYLLGGSSGAEYDTSKVTIQLPFFTGQRPGTFKGYDGIDMAAIGEWSVLAYVDPSASTNGADQGVPGLSGAFVDFGKNKDVTYQGPNWSGGGHFTHIAPRLTNEAAGYACLSEVAFYYEGKEEST